MPSNLASLYVSPPSLDEQIEFAQRKVEKQKQLLPALRAMVMKPQTPHGIWSIC
jgi:hypothetical protein